MEWLAKQFGRALVRRVAFLLVAGLLAYVGIGRAEAQTYGCSTSHEVLFSRCPDVSSAVNALSVAMSNRIADLEANNVTGYSACPIIVSSDAARSSIKAPGGTCTNELVRAYDEGCPNGGVWNAALSMCDIACADKAPLGPTVGLLKSEVCVEGCTYSGVPTKQISLESGGSSIDFGAFGGFTPTGSSCGAMPPEAQPQPYCAPINGQTVCMRPDGSHCAKSATTKKFFCWKPGETGEKTDGPDMQKTNAGPTVIPPSVNLPSGDTLAPVGPSITTTNIDNSTGATSTTTTNNYSTGQGTNAGPGKGQGVGDEGSPGDGKGEGDGDEEGDKGTGSGGGDCDTPPVCTGNAIACWAVEVNWKQGCNSRDSGIDGLNEMSDAINAATGAEAIQWGAALGSDGEGDMVNTRGTRTIDPDDLDASGFLGAGSCPVLPTATVGGRSLPIDLTKICEFLSNLSGFVLAVAYLLAFRIIGGGGRR